MQPIGIGLAMNINKLNEKQKFAPGQLPRRPVLRPGDKLPPERTFGKKRKFSARNEWKIFTGFVIQNPLLLTRAHHHMRAKPLTSSN